MQRFSTLSRRSRALAVQQLSRRKSGADCLHSKIALHSLGESRKAATSAR